MINDFAAVFSSNSKSALLLLLAQLNTAAGLSELAELSGHSGSVAMNALESLVKSKIVTKKRCWNENFYRINNRHKLTPIVRLINSNLENAYLIERSQAYSAKAKRCLKFVSESGRLMNSVKVKKIQE
jgi:hypothetical protein